MRQTTDWQMVYLNAGDKQMQMCTACAMNEHERCLHGGVSLISSEPLDCRDCVICRVTRRSGDPA